MLQAVPIPLYPKQIYQTVWLQVTNLKGDLDVQWGCGGITRCLDVSASQKMVAVVDDANELHVYDLATRKVLCTAEGATSAAWNTRFDDMLCYSGNGYLSIKTAAFPVQRQKFQVTGPSCNCNVCL